MAISPIDEGSHTVFEIRDDGIYRRDQTVTYVGPQTDLVKNLSKFAPRIIPGILSANEILAVTSNGLSVARRLASLALHTYFRPMVDVSEKVCLVPVWKQGTPKATEMKLTWVPPDTMGLYIVLYWECKEKSLNAVNPLPYLVSLAPNKRTYLLPIPNLYGDGRICLGRGGDAIPWMRLGGLVPQLEKATELLQKTSWNTDLLRDTQRETQAMFRFDPDGKQMAIQADWWSLCPTVNLAPYEFLGRLE